MSIYSENIATMLVSCKDIIFHNFKLMVDFDPLITTVFFLLLNLEKDWIF